MHFTYTVPGKPVPKARPRLGRRGFVFTTKKTVDAQAHSRECALAKMPEDWPLDHEYKIELRLFFANRAALPDIDNVLKLHCDALNLVAWHDDRQVSIVYAARFFGGEEKTEVTVHAYETNYVYEAPGEKRVLKSRRRPRTVGSRKKR